ncbi:Phage Terminase Small Subunit [Roseomonas mucosa]|uniref:Phage Terminase Small Subunit n=1 Tax=Roseomonas mucosa TaxID=207340 RepID=A0A4Y1N2B5_9PROT|nr:phage terminase small subunit P27 family [Roseomonas mucosa]AWV23924.1 Phage Terminase Small Subunit [Roseomonas mucosa]MDT8277378.1 phage terminase small subunit P27 family [Roseomonas mucosa]MDT8356415.1 phage terminase small subunit P27 family [Roseomonas mucosa]QDJ10869.1 Phage Terminase Small Subunit [Roseomonas mucosa]
MKGDKPELTVIEGDFAPRRCPSPPPGISDEACKEWRRVAPVLHRRKLLGDDAMATLEAYCRAVGAMRQYSTLMDTEGHILQTERGPVSHPAFKMLTIAMRDVRLYAAELGLTPHRRGKFVDAPKADPWEGMLG